MASLVPGYTYDIFISYRHKDNQTLGDQESSGWVTDFVKHLKREIQSTLKEDVSVYFDENPYDGILDTHDVYDSLKGKLNCLIFVPVLSQTYCDSKSFAWQHEFLAFREISSKDIFGPKVTLKNGNVSSRILPVCIHELDKHDRALLEGEIGPVRAVDFIFRSPGVNRPITPADRRDDNQGRILYKDQINKIALAIKDVIAAMTVKDDTSAFDDPVPQLAPTPKGRSHRAGIIAALLIGIALIGFAITRTSSSTAVREIDKSIAILPFVDMSQGHDLEYLGDGISEEIINSLTAIKDLRTVGRTSSFQFKGEKVDLREVGERLNVAVVLEGSVQQSGDRLRITAKLIRTDDNSPIWSERYDIQNTDIFKIQDNIAGQIVEKLNLTLSTRVEERLIKKETSPEAYTDFLKGLFEYKKERFDEALVFFNRTMGLDSQYAPAYAYTALSKAWIIIRTKRVDDLSLVKEAVRYSEKSIMLDPFLPEGYSGRALIAWAIERDFRKAHIYFEKSVELNPSSSLIKNRYAYFLTWMAEFSKASQLATEAMQSDPVDYNSYVNLYNTALYDEKYARAAVYSREWKRIKRTGHDATTREMQLNFYQQSFQRVMSLADSLVQADNEQSVLDLKYASMASYALNKTKRGDELFKRLQSLRNENTDNACYSTACVYAYRNQADSCLANLKKSLHNHESHFILIKIEPLFKDLHDLPAYKKLYSEGGFDRY